MTKPNRTGSQKNRPSVRSKANPVLAGAMDAAAAIESDIADLTTVNAVKSKKPVKINRIVWHEREVDLDDLKPFNKNPRTISEDELAKLEAAIVSVGYHTRMKANTDMTLAGGHARLIVLKRLGYTKQFVQFPNRKLTSAEFKQVLYQDNKQYGLFDPDMMPEVFTAEELFEFGMSEADILKFFPGDGGEPEDGLNDPDHIPDEQRAVKSKLGDIWKLGPHRLMCGDSCDPAAVKLLFDGAKPNLMVTDPPYGVEYDASWRNSALGSSNETTDGGSVKAKGRAVGKVSNDGRADWREVWANFAGNICYIWHAGKFASIVQQSLEACMFEMRSQIIWVKTRFVISRGDYHWMHEPCWYAVRNKGDWHGDRKQTTVWEIEHTKSDTGHSTQKPVEAMLRPIRNSSGKGDAVFDPFMGSGTTLIAAHQMSRIAYGMELVPVYVDVAVRRWQEFTGLEAFLVETGETFDSIKGVDPEKAKKKKKKVSKK